jgi:hypothetical protein
MMGFWGGYVFYSYSCLFFYWIPKSNNSQCPEEEHTTCSGGPTILLSQARFMGRDIFIKYKYFINIKDENRKYDNYKIMKKQ